MEFWKKFIPLQIYLILKLNSQLFVIFVELIQSSLFKVDPRTERLKYL